MTSSMSDVQMDTTTAASITDSHLKSASASASGPNTSMVDGEDYKPSTNGIHDSSSATLSDATSSESSSRIPSGFPSCLHTEGYPYPVRILHDRLSVSYTQKSMHQLDVGTVRSNHPIPKASQAKVWYYEVDIVDTGEKNQITIGIAPLQSACLFAPGNMHALDTPVPSGASLRQHETASLTCRQVGHDWLSYGVRGDDGRKFHGPILAAGRYALAGSPFLNQAFSAGDTIGCGVNYYDSSIFFTRNGKFIGTAFQLNPADWSKIDIKELRDPSATPIDGRLNFYAAISLHSLGENVKLNFGQNPFKFAVKEFEATEKNRVQAQIAAAKIDSAIMFPLIRSYLLGKGYEKTFEMFQQIQSGSDAAGAMAANNISEKKEDTVQMDTNDSNATTSSATAASTSSPSSSSSNFLSTAGPLTLHDRIAFQTLSQRRAIREYIESGEIERALETIEQVAPNIWLNNPSSTILPAPHSLLTLHFRLVSLQFIKILYPGPTTGSNSSNNSAAAAATRIVEAIQFAQRSFGRYQTEGDPALKGELNELMGLLAYPGDLSTSPLAHLLTSAHRERIAEQVNAAILAVLCTPSNAVSRVHGVSSLELLLRQALTVESNINNAGFPATLPNLADLLQD